MLWSVQKMCQHTNLNLDTPYFLEVNIRHQTRMQKNIYLRQFGLNTDLDFWINLKIIQHTAVQTAKLFFQWRTNLWACVHSACKRVHELLIKHMKNTINKYNGVVVIFLICITVPYSSKSASPNWIWYTWYEFKKLFWHTF